MEWHEDLGSTVLELFVVGASVEDDIATKPVKLSTVVSDGSVEVSVTTKETPEVPSTEDETIADGVEVESVEDSVEDKDEDIMDSADELAEAPAEDVTDDVEETGEEFTDGPSVEVDDSLVEVLAVAVEIGLAESVVETGDVDESDDGSAVVMLPAVGVLTSLDKLAVDGATLVVVLAIGVVVVSFSKAVVEMSRLEVSTVVSNMVVDEDVEAVPVCADTPRALLCDIVCIVWISDGGLLIFTAPDFAISALIFLLAFMSWFCWFDSVISVAGATVLLIATPISEGKPALEASFMASKAWFSFRPSSPKLSSTDVSADLISRGVCGGKGLVDLSVASVPLRSVGESIEFWPKTTKSKRKLTVSSMH